MHTGLFFGSFNPVHIGHLAIASYMSQFTELDEVWLVVSPFNPLKAQIDMAPPGLRFAWTQQAAHGIPGLYVSDVELGMPVPSFTIDTLRRLQKQFPGKKFSIVMGSDGLATFSKWKDAGIIASEYTRYIYPRGVRSDAEEAEHNCIWTNAPRMEISSSFIRESIRQGKSMQGFVPREIHPEVLQYYRSHRPPIS